MGAWRSPFCVPSGEPISRLVSGSVRAANGEVLIVANLFPALMVFGSEAPPKTYLLNSVCVLVALSRPRASIMGTIALP